MAAKILSENILTIDAFLAPSECQDFITYAENEGFKAADVDTGSGRSQMLDIRNNDRVDLVSEELALNWWQRLSSVSLPDIEGTPAVGLSPRFRFYRYLPGQKFNMHKDGRQQVSGNTTLMTLLVYLNAGYTGGTTQFRRNSIEVHAETGKALLFDHQLWHKGTRLETGCKYVLRTDVVFNI